MQKLLVTGGAGFIGSNFVRYILAQRPSWQIEVLDSLTYASNLTSLDGLDNKSFIFTKGDICDEDAIDKAVSKCDAVVHFAAESHVDNSLSGPWPFINTNIVGTFRVLEAVRKHGKRLHHISTDEVFGDLALDSKEKFDENTPYKPSSPYSSSKAGSDMLVRSWVHSFGIEATLSNCSNNYGPYAHVEKFIPRQITNILMGKQAELYGAGENVRDWIHAEDHSSAVLAILEKGISGETYLVGSDGEMTNKEVVELILKLMGRSPGDYKYIPDRPGHDQRYAINSSKIRRELGWKPRYTDFSSGLKNTIDWYKNNRDWWEPYKTAAEARYSNRRVSKI